MFIITTNETPLFSNINWCTSRIKMIWKSNLEKTLFFITIYSLICICYPIQSHADVISNSGNINFDSDGDGNNDIILNNNGLNIGMTSASSNLSVKGNVVFENGKVGIATASPISNLEINTTIGFSSETVSANTTLSGNSFLLADASSGNITLTLPYAGNVSGRIYTIKKISPDNTVTVTAGGNRIGINTSYDLTTSSNTQFPIISIFSNGEQWYFLNKSEGVLQTPPPFNPVLWLDGNDMDSMTLSDGKVVTWADKSGFNHHAIQSSSTNEPELIENGYNERNIIRFDGSNECFFKVADFSLAQPTEIFIVVKWNTTNNTIIDGITANSGSLWTTSTAGDLRMYAGATLSRTVGTMGEWRFLSCAFNGASSQVRSSGVLLGSVANAGTNSMGGVHIGAHGSSDLELDGDIGEVIIYDKTLTDSQREEVELFLRERWNP